MRPSTYEPGDVIYRCQSGDKIQDAITMVLEKGLAGLIFNGMLIERDDGDSFQELWSKFVNGGRAIGRNRCRSCPDPENPDQRHHPNGQRRHVPILLAVGRRQSVETFGKIRGVKVEHISSPSSLLGRTRGTRIFAVSPIGDEHFQIIEDARKFGFYVEYVNLDDLPPG